MTLAQLLALRPGDVVRRRGPRGRLRVVLSQPSMHTRETPGPVCLLKVGRSWTDPNPGAWYDGRAIMEQYLTTNRRAMSAKRALALKAYTHDRQKELRRCGWLP